MEPKKTPLHALHKELGGKMVVFGGWEMPVQYTGIAAEHQAVRERAGLFDASHMGEIRVSGAGAPAYLQWAVTADVSREPGRVMYSPVCLSSGGVLDDILVYRLAEDDYLLVVNAGNKDKDLAWLVEGAVGRPNLSVSDQSDEWALLALQGPFASSILDRVSVDLTGMGRYCWRNGTVAGVSCLVSRTGYTGEDGFELYCPPDKAAFLFTELLTAGSPEGLVPAGLGARDTLRLEAAMPLYGNELSEQISPLEANLRRFVSFSKGDFSGRQALLACGEAGEERKLAGFELTVPGIARHGYPLIEAGRPVGAVTSGTLSPTLGKAIGMGFLPLDLARPGQEIAVGIRGRECAARVVSLPFYRREK